MKENKNIHAGHRQRLQHLVETTDPSDLSDLHFLEHLLTFVIPRADTNPIAHKLLAEFKTITNIFNAEEQALTAIEGIGKKSAKFLNYMTTVYHFYKKSNLSKSASLSTINKVLHFIESILPPSQNEQFIVLIINKNYEIKNYKIFKGISHSYINFDSQKLSSFLVNNKAAFCIFAHTHPHARPEPSYEDYQTFNRLTSLLDSLSIKLLDSLILGEDFYFSSNLSESYPYTFKEIDYTKLDFIN